MDAVTPTTPLDILIADDHALVCEGLKTVLGTMPEVASVDTALTMDELLHKIRAHTYGLCFLDVELNGGSGLDMMPIIRRSNRKTAIVLCTMHEEIWTMHALLKANPDGVVLKLSGVDCIRQAVKAVCRGEKYYCPRFRKLYGRLESASGRDLKRNRPTPRELDVLQAIAEGLSSVEIARRMYVSENTVETYRKNLMAKLEAKNVADMVVKGIERGFVRIGMERKV